ncbi:MAG: response regulator transcription factor [Lachnospiraceae bacterium]|nr:response regulator transcription factor [Lachnospiraceae bacterium]
MYIVICEDEHNFAEELQQELGRILQQKETECRICYCDSGEAFRREMERDEPVDLLFMDLHLGDADGVELVKEQARNSVKIPTVFLSSMEERIAEGYDVNAFHFLFKRNYKEKLPELLERFINEIYERKAIIIQDRDTVVRLQFAEIYYVESDKRNTAIHTAISSYQEKSSIQNFAKQLPEELFIEAYHSLYLNIDHIRKVNPDTVVMDNDKELPVSRRKRTALMNAVMRRIRSR